MTMRAKDFQEPLMDTLYAITAGDLSNHVYHKDVYDQVCAEMGIDPNGFGVMKDGKLIEENDAASLIEQPQQPYTKMLMNATPRFNA